MELSAYTEKLVIQFSIYYYYKYTLGKELRDMCRGILLLIIRANLRRDRVETLEILAENCEILKMTPRPSCWKSFWAFLLAMMAAGSVISGVVPSI